MTPAVSLLLLQLAVSASPQPEKISIAVPDFAAPPPASKLAATLQGVAGHELNRSGVFRVVSAEMVRNLLSLERQKQLLGCTDESSECLAELAGALGAQYLLGGRLSEVRGGQGITYALELNLVNVQRALSEGTEVVNGASEA